jgi:hypothetical protein
VAQGTTTVNFGTFPGATDTSVTVTGQNSILATSLVEAWVFPTATADHSVDEHWVDGPQVMAGNIVAGTGFTIYASVKPQTDAKAPTDSRRGKNDSPRAYGSWTIAWVWN